MKFLLYILILFICSCDELLEHPEPLPYGFSVFEGWASFSEGDFALAEELFLGALNIAPSLVPSYVEAHIGLGWTKLYYANAIDNASNLDRYTLRTEARDNFNSAYIQLEDEESDNNFESDLFAGLAYSNSVLVLHANYLEEESDEYTQLALDYSDSLLEVNSDYYFLYDSTNININSIHLLRAQLYLELEDYTNAQEEIAQVDLSSAEITFNLDNLNQNIEDEYNLYIYVGFSGQDKHLFKMDSVESGYSITRSFTPLVPCVDLIIDEIDLSDDEVVECLNSMPTDLLEYKFSIQFPNHVNEDISDSYDCEIQNFEWIDEIGCVDSWMNVMEELGTEHPCVTNGFRTFEVSISGNSIIIPNVCYESCDSCND